jgi:alkylated DNA repair dioxygenase AlkB
MDLFHSDDNLLPRDGDVRYHGPVLTPTEEAHYLSALESEVPWRCDELIMFGRPVTTARRVAWYGDPGCDYRYSGSHKQALPWIPILSELRQRIEQISSASYNCCLLNLYQDGNQGMGWHRDSEPELVPDAAIASLSLGANRKFSFRNQATGESLSLELEGGSLLVMRGSTQRHWQHSLPKSKRVTKKRINLTFRSIRVRPSSAIDLWADLLQ